MTREQVVRALEQWFAADAHGAAAVYLFGSVARDTARADSDVDVGVLFEKPGRHPGQAIGRSPWLQSVHVDGADHLIGQIVAVEVLRGQQNSLAGELIREPA